MMSKTLLKVFDLDILTSVENWFDLEVEKKSVTVKADCDRTASDIVKELRQVLKVSNPSKALQRSMTTRGTAVVGNNPATKRPSLMTGAPGQMLAEDQNEPELFLF